jgi:serine/threonine protein kinase
VSGLPDSLERARFAAAAPSAGAVPGLLICPRCRTTYSSSALSLCFRDGERLVDHARFLAVERDPLRGVVIGGKYQLLERVGQGGMGTIYRATQAGLNRPVAVKILKRELNVDPDTVARFHREAHAMSQLTHANTVRVYDFGQTEDGLLYLVMELLVGEPISDVMARGPIDVARAVRMTQQILRSLAEAHHKAIVHRDLKPDNLFVARSDGVNGVEGHAEPVIKVLDFGIAKVVAPDRRVDQFETQAGTVFGTPRYMSPEQAQGAPLDGRSDLYSVGCLLYQMLVGTPPFTDEDAVVVMARHIQELPETPRTKVPERPIPEALDQVTMRALAKDPAARFPDAVAFERALEACLPEIHEAQQAAETGRWAPRPARRWVSWSYGLLALVLFGAGYFGVRVYAKMNEAAGPAQDGATSEPLAVESPAPPPEPNAAVVPAAVEPRSEPPRVAPVAPARPSGAVSVALESEPRGAAVYRDGKRIGRTPLSLRVPADQPFVRVELRERGYQPLAAELTALDGAGHGPRRLTLTPLPARPRRAGSAPSARSTPDAIPAATKPAASTPPTPPPGTPYERFE